MGHQKKQDFSRDLCSCLWYRLPEFRWVTNHLLLQLGSTWKAWDGWGTCKPWEIPDSGVGGQNIAHSCHSLFRRDMGKIIFFFQMDGSTYEKQHLESWGSICNFWLIPYGFRLWGQKSISKLGASWHHLIQKFKNSMTTYRCQDLCLTTNACFYPVDWS